MGDMIISLYQRYVIGTIVSQAFRVDKTAISLENMNNERV